MYTKKNIFLAPLLALLLVNGGCGTANTGAVIGGAAIGGNVGGAIGGLAGDSRHGWRGGYRGSAIGTIVGTLAGAAIGGALTTPRPSQTEDEVYPEQHSETYVLSPEDNPRKAFYNLQIHNIRFIDDNRDHIISPDESGKIIFEIMNEGEDVVYDVVPSVTETTGMKHIMISPSVMIERIMPHNGIKYTATISAGKRLKEGNITIRIAVTDTYGEEYAWQEFSLPTK